jgi:hypothetical protein
LGEVISEDGADGAGNRDANAEAAGNVVFIEEIAQTRAGVGEVVEESVELVFVEVGKVSA